MSKHTYHRPYCEPGDLIFFAGRGLVSRAIALGTCSFRQLYQRQWISHVGIVFNALDGTFICESTTLCDWPCYIRQKKINGVQCHPPRQRVEAYAGHVWIARLNEGSRLKSAESVKLSRLCKSKLGTPYDKLGAAICGNDFIKRFWHFGAHSAFCSELCESLIRQIPRNIGNAERAAGTYSPAELARDSLTSGLYDELEPLK
jgi:hypothetical protein